MALPRDLSPHFAPVQFLHAVESEGLEVQVELVGEHFLAFLEEWQIANTEHTDLFDPATPTREIKRPHAPVLEAGQERLHEGVGLWVT